MNARQRREAAGFVAAGGSVQSYPLAARLRPVWARLRGRPVPALRASRTVAGSVWAASPVRPVDSYQAGRPVGRWSR